MKLIFSPFLEYNYETIKKLHKKYPKLIMNPDEWRRLNKKWKKEMRKVGN